MIIRTEEMKNWAAVHAVNASAFETPAEADMVDLLREKAQPVVSLVAEDGDDGAIVGHILFSPVALSGYPELKIMGLAPMAVAPEYQGKGIGSAIVQVGLEQCKQIGFGAVVVLGHPKGSRKNNLTFYTSIHFVWSRLGGITKARNILILQSFCALPAEHLNA